MVDVGPSEWVQLAPGDVVIAHQMLAHGIGSNSSPNIRYQIYFRVVGGFLVALVITFANLLYANRSIGSICT
jgi:ectoine hydroxylase-related dioxygenase (phytanoyl-CoA dioxygenase family)